MRPTAEDSHLVLRILTEWSIPAAHTLVHDGSFDCKVTCASLALSLLSLSRKEISNTVASFIEKWYRDHSQWISAFETAIKIMVGTVIFTHLKLHYLSTGEREQLGGGSRHPTGFNGATTRRTSLTGRSEVPSCV